MNDLQRNENIKAWVSGIKNTLHSLRLNDTCTFQNYYD